MQIVNATLLTGMNDKLLQLLAFCCGVQEKRENKSHTLLIHNNSVILIVLTKADGCAWFL